MLPEDCAKNHPYRQGRVYASVEQRDDPQLRGKAVITRDWKYDVVSLAQ